MQPFDEATGATALLSLLGPNEQNEKELAASIANMLGGLPLAINQIASFILQRKLRMEDFPALYDKHATKIDARKSRLTSYERTLENVWEMSLTKLSGNAVHLHGLLAFFNADAIDEAMLLNGGSAITDRDFAFLSDEME